MRWLLAGVSDLGSTLLTSSNKSEIAVHSCHPALSVLAMLVSRNVFPVVSALQSIALKGVLTAIKGKLHRAFSPISVRGLCHADEA